jgi:hypothetical protein
MKNDISSTMLNFVLAVLVILGVVFTISNILHQRSLRELQPELQNRAQIWQVNSQRMQMLVNDALAYNAKSPNADLTRLLQSATQPAPAAK